MQNVCQNQAMLAHSLPRKTLRHALNMEEI